MSKTVEIPDEYHERTPADGCSPSRPMVTVDEDHIRILTTAFEVMGEPGDVRCFIEGNRVALIPADPGHPNAYTVYDTSGSATIAAGWLTHELERDTQPEGRYPLERDGDLWVVDFAPEGEDNGEPIADGGKAIDASPDVGDRVTYYDSESDPHHALVTWIYGDDPGVGPMINCVRGQDFDLGDTDATDGDYGYQVTHETSVQHRERADETHVYVRGWDA